MCGDAQNPDMSAVENNFKLFKVIFPFSTLAHGLGFDSFDLSIFAALTMPTTVTISSGTNQMKKDVFPGSLEIPMLNDSSITIQKRVEPNITPPPNIMIKRRCGVNLGCVGKIKNNPSRLAGYR
jgi:hypothetical protein